MDLYIYYKVDTQNAQDLRQKIMQMQANLSREWQVESALKRRAYTNLSADIETWMEVYTRTPEGFLNALQVACKANHIDSLIEGTRHIEFFMDMAACV